MISQRIQRRPQVYPLPKRLHDKVADQIDRETSDAGKDA